MKKSSANICILTGPVRSGKTSRLRQWLASGPSAAGFLTPDGKGQRMLYHIDDGSYHLFEVPEAYAGPVVAVGKFRFARSAFALGREWLETPQAAAWTVIDEVGKLEIEQGEGWEPAVGRLVTAFKEGRRQGRLLLVVRDSLLEQAWYQYDLEGYARVTEQWPL